MRTCIRMQTNQTRSFGSQARPSLHTKGKTAAFARVHRFVMPTSLSRVTNASLYLSLDRLRLGHAVAVLQVIVWVGVVLVRDGGLLVGHVAGAAAQVVRGLGVVDEQLAVLAVAARLLPGDAHDIPDRLGLAEDDVHLLERPVGGLGVEEVHDGDDEGIAVRR